MMEPGGLRASAEWPYLATAAVLSDFSAESLEPLGGGKPDLALIGGMLMKHGEAIRIGPSQGRWTLSSRVRRAVITELTRQDQMKEALAANRGTSRSDNPTQRAIDELLEGGQPELANKTLPELIGLERAISLLGPSVRTPEGFAVRVVERLDRARLLDPLDRLLAHGFAGRIEELKQLRSYVDELPPESFAEAASRWGGNFLDLFRDRPPLVIWGPGGAGKSTLIAKFLRDHLANRPDLPFVYLDFGRTQIDPESPDTLLTEAVRQIRIQFPAFASFTDGLDVGVEQRTVVEDVNKLERSEHYERSAELRRRFVQLLRRITTQQNTNFLLFADTFEIVQRRGPAAVFKVLMFAAELLTDVPRLRFVIAGRSELRDRDFTFSSKAPSWKALPLDGFDPESGIAYLRMRLAQLRLTDAPEATLRKVVTSVRGNPLSLRLAAELFAREGLGVLQDTIQLALFDARFSNERVQGMLHGRILATLSEPVQKIADPGLILRRITPEVIARVLAVPCGLALTGAEDAQQLFETLRDEAGLVEPAGENAVKHRAEVRAIMLPLLRHRLREKAREIDEAAVAFWASEAGAEARAEEIYHRVWLGADDAALHEAWNRGPVAKPELLEALDEFDTLDVWPVARITLSRLLERDLPADLEEKADQEQWEANAERRARSLLASGAAEETLNTIRARTQRNPASPLWLLEIQALKLLGREKEALDAVSRALKAAADANAPGHLLAIHLQEMTLLERAERLEEAKTRAVSIVDLAVVLGDVAREFEVRIALSRLSRKLSHEEPADLDRRLASMIDHPIVEAALVQSPVLLQEAAAEIGDLRPELLIQVAERAEGRSGDSETEVVRLLSLGAAYAQRGDSARAIESLDRAHNLIGEASNEPLKLRISLQLAAAYRDAGNLDTAMALFESSLSQAQALGDANLEAVALTGLGTGLELLGRSQDATERFEAALLLARVNHDAAGEAAGLFNLARNLGARGEWAPAIELLHQDLAITRKLGDRHGERQTLTLMGSAYGELHAFDRAAEAYLQALRIAVDLDDRIGQCMILARLGLLSATRRDLEQCERYFRDALRIAETLNSPLIEATILGNLATVLRVTRKLPEARSLHERQLKILDVHGDPASRVEALRNFAQTLEVLPDTEAAERALALAEELSPRTPTSTDSLEVVLRRPLEEFDEVKQSDLGDLRALRDSTRRSVEVQIRQKLDDRSS